MAKGFYFSIQPKLLKSAINCAFNDDFRLARSLVHNLRLWDYQSCNNILIHLAQSSGPVSLYSRHSEERIEEGGGYTHSRKRKEQLPTTRSPTCQSAQFFKSKGPGDS